MATQIKGTYKGDYRCSLTHIQSSDSIITDAPTDNNGKGEHFSPTDLLAAGLGSCMITILAIRAKKKNITIGYPTYSIKKYMKASPRAIDIIELEITIYEKLKQAEKDFLEKEAKNCPVALSLNEKIQQKVSFRYV